MLLAISKRIPVDKVDATPLGAVPGTGWRFDMLRAFVVNGAHYDTQVHKGYGSTLMFLETPPWLSGTRGPLITASGRFFHQSMTIGFGGTSDTASNLAAQTYFAVWYGE